MSVRVVEIAIKHLNPHALMNAEVGGGGYLYRKFAEDVATELEQWHQANLPGEPKCDHPEDGLEVIRQGSALMVLCSKCMCSCLTDQDVWEPFEERDGKRSGQETS
jgi:hypothetical protein